MSLDDIVRRRKAEKEAGRTLDDLKASFKARFDSLIAECRTELEAFTASFSAIEPIPGPPGPPGEPGSPGHTPLKNVDYFDGEDGYTPKKGIDYFDGEPGETVEGPPGPAGSPDTPLQIAEKVNTLEEAIDMKVLRGMKSFIREVNAAIKAAGKPGRGQKVKGGGHTIKPGPGQTLVRNPDGTVTLTVSGGASALLAEDRLAGTQSGSNVTLDLTGLPHTVASVLQVTRQGQLLTPTTDYTISGNTVTIFNASIDEVFLVLYLYAS